MSPRRMVNNPVAARTRAGRRSGYERAEYIPAEPIRVERGGSAAFGLDRVPAAKQAEACTLNRSDPKERFAREVADLMDGPILRYSARAALLRRAERLGIGRFEANLIIATVQHRCTHPAPDPAPPRQRAGIFAAATMVLAAEAAMLLAAWCWWH